MSPAVSLVIPVYNGGDFLEGALASVAAQTFRDFEAIVLNDGSTDASSAIAHGFAERDPRFRVIDKPNGGLVATLNQGVGLARAPLIARMDADDISLPDRLEKQIAYLAAYPGCVALGTLSIIVDEKGAAKRRMVREMVVPPGPGAPPYPPRRYRLIHPTVVFRRAAFIAAGGYSNDFHAAEDYELWLRMSEQGDIAELREPLLHYRVHSASVTATVPDRQRLSCLRADLVTTLRRAGTPAADLAPLHSEQPIDEILATASRFPGAPPAKIVRLRYDAEKLRVGLYRGSARERRALIGRLWRGGIGMAATKGWRGDYRAAALAAGKELARWIVVSLTRRHT